MTESPRSNPSLDAAIVGIVVVGAAVTIAAEPNPPRAELPRVALRETRSTPIAGQSGYFAWLSATCDANGDVFFLVAPHGDPDDVDPETGNARVPPPPSEVLRVSADGKERTWFDPAEAPQLADADAITTTAMALDRRGRLVLAVWARWRERGGPYGEGGRQYLLSFDTEGEPGSLVEVAWEDLLVRQLEVFGSGEFSLFGIQPRAGRVRLSVLPEAGGELRDVIGWPNYPSEWADEAGAQVPRFDLMARGGDGQIYVTSHGSETEEVLVFAIEPALGHAQEAFRLAPMPPTHHLLAWKTSGSRLAAAYEERGSAASASGGDDLPWWIAVYAYGQPGALYGPAPGPPLCYQRGDFLDRFTFFASGPEGWSLSTMTPVR